MDASGFSAVDNRAGVTFGVELYVPWDGDGDGSIGEGYGAAT